MTNTINANVAIFREPGAPLVLQDVALLPANIGELIVEIDMCTICGSDVHTIEGRRPVAGPMVLGHEMVGRVSQLPEASVRDLNDLPLQLGDRITWSLHSSCGTCYWCQNQLSQKCDSLFKYGHEPISEEYPSTGGFGSHCQLRAGTAIVRVPESVSDLVACPANCATSTVAAAFRQAGDCRGKSVMILGAGMLGLTATAMAHDAGAAWIMAVDPNEPRAEMASRFGASVVTSDLAAAQYEVQLATHGRGADIAFDFSGNNDAVLAAIHFVRIGGQAVLVGSVFPNESISLSPEMIVRRCLRISGVHNYLAEDLNSAIDFLQRSHSKYPFEALVSVTYPLADIEQAVRHAAAGDAVRVAIV